MLLEVTPPNPDRETIRAVLAQARAIAVVGLSPKPTRASYNVAAYLQKAGFTIIPVNPLVTEVLGVPSVPSLDAIQVPVDIVDVFRRSEEVPPIADQAVALGAKCLWLQEGVTHAQAAARAAAAGLVVVQDRCLKIEHHRLFS